MTNNKVITLDDLEFQLYLSHVEIQEAITKIADQVTQDYSGKEIVVLGVLDGSVMVLADLIRKLDLRMTIELIRIKSYMGTKSTSQVQELLGLTTNLEGKEVLIIEDIVDTGGTLEYVKNLVQSHNPKSLKIASLLFKEEVYTYKNPPDYVGFRIPNKFVVGYGMDYNGEGRQLNDIYALSG